ncbi:hypothetical protein MH117_11280 [Paenibacillus sp. ACRRX]|uniref:hypothetical protein n=1 Tax=Paenibacillus sp. ACRRX TaxID=2918206 RepID=UPI001EF707C5|nr:hypothetical protein [Paenibacillus sp. ACRRX]MCG7408003.1 hypothetical protein [Paenibacillus sp. ACRRX]
MTKRKEIVAGLLSAAMISAMLAPVYTGIAEAASSNGAATKVVNNAYKPTTLNKVTLNGKSYIEVNDLQFYHVEGDKYAYFTVTVHNNNSKSMNLMDYWFSITSNSGEKYSVQLLGLTDKKDNIIGANTNKTFKIYSKVNPKLNLFNLSLNVIKWDFSMPGFERKLGSIRIPNNYSTVTPIGKDREIKQSDNSIITTASALQLVNVGNSTEAMVSMYFKNSSASAVNLNNHKFYLRTTTNSYYALEADRPQISVLPGEKIKVNFYAKLPLNIKKSNYQMFIAEEVGTEAKQQLPIATFGLMIRELKHTVTGLNKTYNLLVDKQEIESKITNTMVDSNKEYHNVTLTYQLKNVGKKGVKAPKYKYELMTEQRVSYPLETVELTGDLLPGISQEATMTTSIPADIKISNLKLVVKKIADENKSNDYLLAQYQVPDSSEVTTGSKTTYVNKQGAYEVQVENFERLPWDSQDTINAVITVKNIGSNTQPMPDIAATAWLNGVKIDSKDIHLLKVDEAIGLKPGETAKLIATSKVASDSKFDSARIQLSEVINEKPTNTIGNFMIAADKATLPTFTPGSTAKYTLQQPSVKAELNVLETNTYEGKNKNVVQALLSYRNIGDRYAKLPNVHAYFTDGSDVAIPAKIALSDKELGPDGVNLISVSADVPKKYRAADLKLIVGQGIIKGKYIAGTEKPDSYVNAAVLGLTDDKTKVNSLFDVLELRPYSFNINKINAQTNNTDQVLLNFEYNLSVNNPFAEVLAERNLLFEIEYNGKKFEKKYKLGDGNDKLSNGDKIKESFAIDDYAMKGVAYSGFTLRVYEEFNEARKLLLSHKVENFGS